MPVQSSDGLSRLATDDCMFLTQIDTVPCFLTLPEAKKLTSAEKDKQLEEQPQVALFVEKYSLVYRHERGSRSLIFTSTFRSSLRKYHHNSQERKTIRFIHNWEKKRIKARVHVTLRATFR